jgi:poly-gamma-glutamate capsule biosynthesis protein CapA/YwtB (metallophosphatase superfamily)
MLMMVRLAGCLLLLLTACQSKKELSIVFGGDVMLDRGIRAQIAVKGVGHFTSDIQSEFQAADFAVVNLECPATAIKAPLTKKFIFRAEPEWLPELYKAGITHCILANNHSYDQGRAGLISTDENLENAQLKSIGYGVDQQEACKPVVLQKDGIDVAIFSSVTLGLESWMYLENEPGMCQATIQDLKGSVLTYKQQHPEAFIVVTLHWGIEYQVMPTMMQQKEAKELIAAGADAIIGHHPHVVQRFEWIDGKPVFYSVGNLIFDNANPVAAEGILVKLVVGEFDGELVGEGLVGEEHQQGQRRRSGVKIVPYRIVGGKPVLMEGGERDVFFGRLQEVSDRLPL